MGLKDLLHDGDLHEGDYMSYLEFTHVMADDRIETFVMERLVMDMRDVELFFLVLREVMGVDQVQTDIFVDLLMRLSGRAAAIDIQVLQYQMQTVNKRTKDMLQQFGSRLDSIVSVVMEKFSA